MQRDLMMLDLDETDELYVAYTTLEDNIFNISLCVYKLLQAVKDTSMPSKNEASVKLPKLNVPKFDIDIHVY